MFGSPPPSYFIAKVGSPAALRNLQRVDEMAEQGVYPVLGDLWPAVYVAVVLCVARWGLHRCLFKPMAIRALKLKLAEGAHSDPILDKTFKKKKTPSVSEIKELLPQLSENLSVEQVQQEFWLRRRRASQELRITKFVEALWRFIFYTFFTLVGFFTLYYPVSVPWLESPLLYFDHWPVEPINKAVQMYYLLELGSYLHQLVWTDVSRSDSVEMMSHHIITILLISVSYVMSFIRIGTIIMVIHDVPDVFLECGKCMNYIGKAKGGEWLRLYTDIMFGIFATLFFISRIVIYPYIVYHANTVCDSAFGPGYPFSYCFFIFLLVSLQALHVFWFYLILRMAYRLLWLDGGTDDIRSDDDDEDELPSAAKREQSSSSGEAAKGSATRKPTTRSSSKKEQ